MTKRRWRVRFDVPYHSAAWHDLTKHGWLTYRVTPARLCQMCYPVDRR